MLKALNNINHFSNNNKIIFTTPKKNEEAQNIIKWLDNIEIITLNN